MGSRPSRRGRWLRRVPKSRETVGAGVAGAWVVEAHAVYVVKCVECFSEIQPHRVKLKNYPAEFGLVLCMV